MKSGSTFFVNPLEDGSRKKLTTKEKEESEWKQKAVVISSHKHAMYTCQNKPVVSNHRCVL